MRPNPYGEGIEAVESRAGGCPEPVEDDPEPVRLGGPVLVIGNELLRKLLGMGDGRFGYRSDSLAIEEPQIPEHMAFVGPRRPVADVDSGEIVAEAHEGAFELVGCTRRVYAGLHHEPAVHAERPIVGHGGLHRRPGLRRGPLGYVGSHEVERCGPECRRRHFADAGFAHAVEEMPDEPVRVDDAALLAARIAHRLDEPSVLNRCLIDVHVIPFFSFCRDMEQAIDGSAVIKSIYRKSTGQTHRHHQLSITEDC